MPMQNPPHPGEIVKWECLEPLGLTVKRAAHGLGVTRQALSSLINGRSGISTEMACRLSAAFGSSPETWLRMQMAYDLSGARERLASIEVERFTDASPTAAPAACAPAETHHESRGRTVPRPEEPRG